ncbi:Undecaprenyl-diphosphatase [Poriferisphaera corsica]|uniref:Undecaprenyl-diphosphatase n=1 Tax=Poriferisphaera corsica TaxID=2528020 RepID=A0A517YVK0_9BACT|nr:undecaprenyl-diphosphate phosphatase [Poriferisphaera corsica]QDU34239.1 Undecaprenyl-diphosphatase [Poriferisphaera corsica]
MTWWEAIILGLVEGITEYLPVSSTGHLILTQKALNLTGPAANAFAICIQAGAIIAVLGLYYKRFIQMTRGFWLRPLGLTKSATPDLQKSDVAGQKLAFNIIIAFLPAAVIGLLFDDLIEQKLFGLYPVTAAWFFGGLAILITVWLKKFHAKKQGISAAELKAATNAGNPLESLTALHALAIGFIQCIAMWPGTSRSLVTIVGGLIVGLSAAAAVEFSFLLGVITLLAATLYKSLDAGPIMLEQYGWTPMLIGSLAAWLSAALSIKWLVGYLKSHGLQIFGYYRILLALITLTLLLLNLINNN